MYLYVYIFFSHAGDLGDWTRKMDYYSQARVVLGAVLGERVTTTFLAQITMALLKEMCTRKSRDVIWGKKNHLLLTVI